MHLRARLTLVAHAPRPSLWLALTDPEGRTGAGEASPLPPFSREPFEACARALEAFAARLVTVDARGPADNSEPSVAVQAISASLAAAAEFAVALAAAPAARFAVETALSDLLAQRRGCSVAELLGGARPYDVVPVNGLLIASAAAPDALADQAADLAASGLTAIKIKLRARDEAGFQAELAALRAVRERLPLPFELRLDPNAAWTLPEARRRLAQLAPIAPRYVEQPVAPHELLALGRAALPWAADESLTDPAIAEALLASEGCAAFVIKPHVLGLLRARELAVRAQERGLDVVVTHFFDGPVAMAAAAELALSLPRAPLASGLDRHPGLADWPDVAIPQLAQRGFVRPSGAAGLGLSLPGGMRASRDPTGPASS